MKKRVSGVYGFVPMPRPVWACADNLASPDTVEGDSGSFPSAQRAHTHGRASCLLEQSSRWGRSQVDAAIGGGAELRSLATGVKVQLPDESTNGGGHPGSVLRPALKRWLHNGCPSARVMVRSSPSP